MHRSLRRALGACARLGATSAAVALIATALTLSAAPRPAGACSCGTRRDDAAFADADAVFTGVLVEVRTPPGERYSSADAERFVFEVDRIYKGEVFTRQSVVTPREGASCGLELSVETGRILVFGRRGGDAIVKPDDGEVGAHLCNGTRPVLASNPVPFGDGVLPRAGSSPIGGGPSNAEHAVQLAIIGGVAIVLVLGALALARRRRA